VNDTRGRDGWSSRFSFEGCLESVRDHGDGADPDGVALMRSFDACPSLSHWELAMRQAFLPSSPLRNQAQALCRRSTKRRRTLLCSTAVTSGQYSMSSWPDMPDDIATLAVSIGQSQVFRSRNRVMLACGFIDQVDISRYARVSACWLKATEITTNNPYGPSSNVSRAQMTAFLYRLGAEQGLWARIDN